MTTQLTDTEGLEQRAREIAWSLIQRGATLGTGKVEGISENEGTKAILNLVTPPLPESNDGAGEAIQVYDDIERIFHGKRIFSKEGAYEAIGLIAEIVKYVEGRIRPTPPAPSVPTVGGELDRQLWGLLNGFGFDYATVQPNENFKPDTAAYEEEKMRLRIASVDGIYALVQRYFAKRADEARAREGSEKQCGCVLIMCESHRKAQQAKLRTEKDEEVAE